MTTERKIASSTRVRNRTHDPLRMLHVVHCCASTAALWFLAPSSHHFLAWHPPDWGSCNQVGSTIDHSTNSCLSNTPRGKAQLPNDFLFLETVVYGSISYMELGPEALWRIFLLGNWNFFTFCLFQNLSPSFSHFLHSQILENNKRLSSEKASSTLPSKTQKQKKAKTKSY